MCSLQNEVLPIISDKEQFKTSSYSKTLSKVLGIYQNCYSTPLNIEEILNSVIAILVLFSVFQVLKLISTLKYIVILLLVSSIINDVLLT